MQVVAELHIVLTTDGSVSVNGATENRFTAYAMLELAKDAIRKHAEAAEQKVSAPAPSDVARFGQKKLD